MFIRKVFGVLKVLWAGSLWSLAAWVAPTLFHAQPDRHLAGILAARLFGIETYIGIAVALLASVLGGARKFLWGYAAAALLAVNEWILKPVMMRAHADGAVASLSFGAWHGVSAVLYLTACAAVLLLIWREQT
jgi:membrane protein YqaA with SNARE-associated domain